MNYALIGTVLLFAVALLVTMLRRLRKRTI